MPRTSKFDRDRIAKLLGKKHKPIRKEDVQKLYISPLLNEFASPTGNLCRDFYKPFKTSNYVTLEKTRFIKHRGQQIEKISYRTYSDAEIFGDDYIEYLKKNHDHDHDTPPDQVRYDVAVGIKKLKECLDSYVEGENREGASSVHSTKSKGQLRYKFYGKCGFDGSY